MKTKKFLTLSLKHIDMKNSSLFLALFLSIISALAQENPFEEYGYTPKIATLSQGQYNESFDNDTIVQIGSVLFNTQTKQIVAFVEYDTLYSEATLEPDVVSRWMSPDPLAAKYTDLSPYNFVANNPIIFVDPDGREIWIVSGSQKVKYENGELYKRNGKAYDGNNAHLLAVREQLSTIQCIDHKDVKKLFETLQEKTHDHVIILQIGSNETKTTTPPTGLAGYQNRPGFDGVGASSEISYDYKNNTAPDGESRSPEIGIAHELSHAYDRHLGQQNDAHWGACLYCTEEEASAVNFENIVREYFNTTKRTDYNEIPIPGEKLPNSGGLDFGQATSSKEVDVNSNQNLWKISSKNDIYTLQ